MVSDDGWLVTLFSPQISTYNIESMILVFKCMVGARVIP